jgi:hypothetical protein
MPTAGLSRPRTTTHRVEILIIARNSFRAQGCRRLEQEVLTEPTLKVAIRQAHFSVSFPIGSTQKEDSFPRNIIPICGRAFR